MNTTMRDAFFDRLYTLAHADRNILIVSADMGAPALDKFRRDLGDQFINVGIAEQNMVAVSTGLAMAGKKVFMYAIMPFATARCYELLKVDLSLMNLPITVVGVGAGFGYEDSGPTHHSTEDLTLMRALPKMTILSPADSVSAAAFAGYACQTAGPSYVRLDRQPLPNLYPAAADFSAGLSIIRPGRDVWILATGLMTHRALELARALETHSFQVGVVDLYRIKPLPTEALLATLGSATRLITLEEHLLSGGVGSLLAETLADHHRPISLKRLGVDDQYIYAYGRGRLHQVAGLDLDQLVQTTLKWLTVSAPAST